MWLENDKRATYFSDYEDRFLPAAAARKALEEAENLARKYSHRKRNYGKSVYVAEHYDGFSIMMLEELRMYNPLRVPRIISRYRDGIRCV
jgi:hypothetical protein